MISTCISSPVPPSVTSLPSSAEQRLLDAQQRLSTEWTVASRRGAVSLDVLTSIWDVSDVLPLKTPVLIHSTLMCSLLADASADGLIILRYQGTISPAQVRQTISGCWL